MLWLQKQARWGPCFWVAQSVSWRQTQPLSVPGPVCLQGLCTAPLCSAALRLNPVGCRSWELQRGSARREALASYDRVGSREKPGFLPSAWMSPELAVFSGALAPAGEPARISALCSAPAFSPSTLQPRVGAFSTVAHLWLPSQLLCYLHNHLFELKKKKKTLKNNEPDFSVAG